MLKMELPQESLEEAVQDYLAKLGLNLPVVGIEFTAQRSNGNKILTELTLGAVGQGTDAPPAASAPQGVSAAKAAPAPVTEAPTEENKEEGAETTEEDEVPGGKSLFG